MCIRDSLRGVTAGRHCRGRGIRFQPALPLRGVTPMVRVLDAAGNISTRTPLAGSDDTREGQPWSRVKFQPALPLRGVTPAQYRITVFKRFQPALPLRGVTEPCLLYTSGSGPAERPCGQPPDHRLEPAALPRGRRRVGRGLHDTQRRRAGHRLGAVARAVGKPLDRMGGKMCIRDRSRRMPRAPDTSAIIAPASASGRGAVW